MKRTKAISVIILLAVVAGCGGGNKQSTDDIITVDVTKKYPKKELILQDFMDVEYIVLDDTDDDFLTQGMVLAIGKNMIVAKNFGQDGNIYLYDRNGKGIKKINRMGQGPEEYTSVLRIMLDEDNSEMFVNALSLGKIMVYDFDGNFKRSFNGPEESRYLEGLIYDDKHLIFYHSNYYERENYPYPLSYDIVSKQDGSITQKIQTSVVEKKISRSLTFVDEATNRGFTTSAFTWYPISHYQGNFIFVQIASDTVYQYSPIDDMISPFIVRTPSIQSMKPEVFLFVSFLTDGYYFMETVKKEYDPVADTGWPNTYLVYDRQEKAIFECVLYNGDYSDKRTVDISHVRFRPLKNDEIAIYRSIEAYQLVEDYEEGLLKGKLKEIAAGLNAESNPVIMVAKHKK